MLCTSYNLMSHRERIEYIGKLLHSVQSDDKLFTIGRAIIKQAEDNGLLDDVIINPNPIEPIHDPDISSIS